MATFNSGYNTINEYLLRGIVQQEGDHVIIANGISYNVEVVIIGKEDDIDEKRGNATADERTLIIIAKENLIIPQGYTFTPQVRKRGMYVFVNGSLIVEGSLSMTARGAHAAGQDVFIHEDNDNGMISVSAEGGNGGARFAIRRGRGQNNGNNGNNGETGGGGSGGANHEGRYNGWARGGAGSRGTSYSGGSGGGGSHVVSRASPPWEDANIDGGRGGYGRHWGFGRSGSGGSGNPGGGSRTGHVGNNGTGGLLVVYSNDNIIVANSGSIRANGVNGRWARGGGGASGGGSINLIYEKEYINYGNNNITVNGGSGSGTARGGHGGNGSLRDFQTQTKKIGVIYKKTGKYEYNQNNYALEIHLNSPSGQTLSLKNIGKLLAGATSFPPRKVYAYNHTNIPINNLHIECMNQDLPTGIEIEISKIDGVFEPFVPSDELMFNETIQPEGYVEFYIRIKTTIFAEIGKTKFYLKTEYKEV